MQTLAYGETLVNKSVEAVCVYVSHFVKHLITDPRYTRGPDGKYHHYEEPCNRLQEYITCHTPRDVAGDVTFRIIIRVNGCYTTLINDGRFKSACEEIAPYILKSVIHPSVKCLDFLRDNWHPTLLDFYNNHINGDLIYRTLPLLRDLKVLRTGKLAKFANIPLDVEGFKDTLEEFASRNYSDRDMETLANKCKLIRSLELGGERTNRSNIFDLISRFECLEELNLRQLSFLSRDELSRILCWLVSSVPFDESSAEDTGDIGTCTGASSQAGDEALTEEFRRKHAECLTGQMKSFGCANVTADHINLISMFYNLTSLALCEVSPSCSLAPLRRLNQLKNFTLINTYFFNAEQFLTTTGNQLTCLKLVDVFGTKFTFISQKCRSLKCLHLLFSRYQYLVLPENYRDVDFNSLPVAAFPFVDTLQLSVYERITRRYIVSHFVNLRKLSVLTTGDDFVLLDCLIRRTRLTRLEELHWGQDTAVIFSEREYQMYKFVIIEGVIVQRIAK